MIGLASPYPGREPTLPLVAGPGRGPARHLGDRARPTRHHPDPPTPIAHGTLPAVPPTGPPRPRPRPPRSPRRGRPAGRVHSRYERTLADLPWGEHALALGLRVRRLF